MIQMDEIPLSQSPRGCRLPPCCIGWTWRGWPMQSIEDRAYESCPLLPLFCLSVPAPDAPANLSATVLGTHMIALLWNNVPNDEGRQMGT